MNTFTYSEDALAARLGITRKVLAAERRKKTAAGQWVARDGDVFYSELGLCDMLVAIGFATRTLSEGFRMCDGYGWDVLLEKPRRIALAEPLPTVPATAPAHLRARILRQYPNRHFWRAIELTSGIVIDIYEPKRPWVISLRKIVYVESVPGKNYFKLCKPRTV